MECCEGFLELCSPRKWLTQLVSDPGTRQADHLGLDAALRAVELPSPSGRVNALTVFKSVSGSRPATAATCLVGTRGWPAEACRARSIPRISRDRAAAKSVASYALRGCSPVLLAGPKPALASCSQVAAGGDHWLLMAVRGHLGDTCQMRRPDSGSSGTVSRPSVFQAGHTSWTLQEPQTERREHQDDSDV